MNPKLSVQRLSKKTIKYFTLLFTFMFSIASCSINHLTDDEQIKLMGSIISGDLNKNDSVYFAAEPVVDSTTAKILNPGEIAIHLVSKKFSPGSRYRLFATSSAFECKFIFNLTADKNGELLIENNPKDKLENFLVSLWGHMPGEEKVFTLISEDGLNYKSAIAVQKPLIALAQDGAILKLRLMSKNADSFLIQCTGLNPNEKFSFSSKSCDEKIDWSELADAQGNWQSMLRPAVIGHEGGLGYIELIRENGEVLGIRYVWGENAIKITKDEIKRNNSKHK